MEKSLELNDSFKMETFEIMNNRHEGFGKMLYSKIQLDMPQIFKCLTFYQRIDCQEEDSYAEYKNNNKYFGIQLDPLCQVICLWNNDIQIEIGTWVLDEISEAIDYIKINLLDKTK